MASYLDVLEGAFLVRRLPPWLPNVRKRLVRTPRVYWRDSGLLHAITGVRTFHELLHQPWVGSSWEGFVIQQVLGTLAALGVPVEPSFFRTSDGVEIDLVFKLGSQVWAVEVKLSSRPSPDDFDRLNRAADLAGADCRYLVARVTTPAFGPNGGVVSYWAMRSARGCLLAKLNRGRNTGGGLMIEA